MSLERLTFEQKRVAFGIALGFTNAAIATYLGLGLAQVGKHASNIYKLCASPTLQADDELGFDSEFDKRVAVALDLREEEIIERLSPEIPELLIHPFPKVDDVGTWERLTPQDKQICRLTARSWSKYAIGKRLGIDNEQVSWAQRHILRKLGVSYDNRVPSVVLAILGIENHVIGRFEAVEEDRVY